MSYNLSRSSGLLQAVEREIKANELTADSTTQTIEALRIPRLAIVKDVTFVLDEEFDGGATSELTIQIGDGTDPDGYITAKSVHADATSVETSTVDGAYLNDETTDNVINGKQYTSEDTLDVLFTATGANVSVLTAGKVRVIVTYLDIA